MLAILLFACVGPRLVVALDPLAAPTGDPAITTFGPVEAKDGQYPGTPSIFRCVVANGYVTVAQDLSLSLPAEMPRYGWCGDAEGPASIRFQIVPPA